MFGIPKSMVRQDISSVLKASLEDNRVQREGWKFLKEVFPESTHGDLALWLSDGERIFLGGYVPADVCEAVDFEGTFFTEDGPIEKVVAWCLVGE
jgi:hypothetical protein